ncbi:MAG: GNAT family N-acetyltransferase [Acidimicrobiales bacterium]
MHDRDLGAVVVLHREVLDMEFLSRFGPRFLHAYYRAWISTPGAVALVALEDDVVVGGLLGASDPGCHVRAMVRDHGMTLALRQVGAALTDPRLARDLVVTRAARYARGLMRLVTSRWRPPANVSPDGPVVGEITHVLVAHRSQGHGVGRALVEAALAAFRAAGVRSVELVTPPDLAARHFYERLGWRLTGELASRSGEPFLRFVYDLDA